MGAHRSYACRPCRVILMTTRILKPTPENIALCARHMRDGGLVAFPTETVYALGAVATNADAVRRVFDVKGRPLDKALIVAVSDSADIASVARTVPKKARILIEKFMPGALTVLLDKADCIPSVVTAGSPSVAVRIPDNPVALRLIELVGAPVVVPSANTSDKPSPTLGKHVLDDLDGKIAYILDGGPSKIGIESTIVDVREDPPVIVRGGGVSADRIAAEIGEVVFKRETPKQSSAYSPCADVYFSAYYDGMAKSICARYDETTARGGSVVILCLEKNRDRYGDRAVFSVGDDYADYAHNLFALLRRADAERFDTVIAEGVPTVGIGASLVNRLIKISGGKII
ncbi:MAG: L-threonylcarbamoyladenylate synthase [Roseburia sp.]|nr:L-threonylcarbamoyladenylate synthase [Roseburia sp.]